MPLALARLFFSLFVGLVLALPAQASSRDYHYGQARSPLVETTADGTITQLNIYAPAGLVATSTAGDTSFFGTNHLGSTVLVSDPGGIPQQAFDYTVYGTTDAIQLNSSTVNLHYRFQGHEYDAEVAMYNFKARNYQPGTATFLRADPAAVSTSPYTAFGQNPISFVDLDGRIKTWAELLSRLRRASVVYVGDQHDATDTLSLYNLLLKTKMFDGALIEETASAAFHNEVLQDDITTMKNTGKSPGGDLYGSAMQHKYGAKRKMVENETYSIFLQEHDTISAAYMGGNAPIRRHTPPLNDNDWDMGLMGLGQAGSISEATRSSYVTFPSDIISATKLYRATLISTGLQHMLLPASNTFDFTEPNAPAYGLLKQYRASEVPVVGLVMLRHPDPSSYTRTLNRVRANKKNTSLMFESEPYATPAGNVMLVRWVNSPTGLPLQGDPRGSGGTGVFDLGFGDFTF